MRPLSNAQLVDRLSAVHVTQLRTRVSAPASHCARCPPSLPTPGSLRSGGDFGLRPHAVRISSAPRRAHGRVSFPLLIHARAVSSRCLSAPTRPLLQGLLVCARCRRALPPCNRPSLRSPSAVPGARCRLGPAVADAPGRRIRGAAGRAALRGGRSGYRPICHLEHRWICARIIRGARRSAMRKLPSSSTRKPPPRTAHPACRTGTPNPQDPCPSRFLRNRHRLDGRREVGPRRQPIPAPVEAPVTVPIQLRERDRIDSGRSSIGLHPLVCLQHQPIRNRKGFRRHRRLILPRELTTGATGTIRPLCSAPITDASSLVRVGPSSVRASVLCASLFFTWQAPLTSRPRVPAVPPKRLNRARAISMPDTAHPVGRLPMGSSQR